MGSLMVAGAIEGLGAGMKENVVRRTEDRRRQEDKDYELQLANMRMEFEREQAGEEREYLTSERLGEQKYETEAADILYGRESEEAEKQRQHEIALTEMDIDFKTFKTNADNESDEWQTLMGRYIGAMGSGAAGTKGKAGDFDIEYVAGVDFQTGEPTAKIIAKHPNGTTFEQIGDRVIEAGLSSEEQTEALAPWGDKDAQAAAEYKLKIDMDSGKDSSDWFLKTFKYLPTWYLRQKYQKDNASQLGAFFNFVKQTRPEYFGKQPQSTPDRMDRDSKKEPYTQGEQLEQTGPPAPQPEASVGPPLPEGYQAKRSAPTPHSGGAFFRGAWDVLSSGGKGGALSRAAANRNQ